MAILGYLVDRDRLTKAANLLSQHQHDADHAAWRIVFGHLVTLGWHEDQEIGRVLLSAPPAWLRDEGIEPPEDVLVRLREEGVAGLEIAYKDGEVRRVPAEDLGCLALVIETMRLFPGAALADGFEKEGKERWPKMKADCPA